jgi:hypothetical protein
MNPTATLKTVGATPGYNTIRTGRPCVTRHRRDRLRGAAAERGTRFQSAGGRGTIVP